MRSKQFLALMYFEGQATTLFKWSVVSEPTSVGQGFAAEWQAMGGPRCWIDEKAQAPARYRLDCPDREMAAAFLAAVEIEPGECQVLS